MPTSGGFRPSCRSASVNGATASDPDGDALDYTWTSSNPDVTLLLVLSQHSVQSDWAEHEVRVARKLEKDLGEAVLCLISLDDAWKTPLWQGKILEQAPSEQILSFADWRDGASMRRQFEKLIETMAVSHP